MTMPCSGRKQSYSGGFRSKSLSSFSFLVFDYCISHVETENRTCERESLWHDASRLADIFGANTKSSWPEGVKHSLNAMWLHPRAGLERARCPRLDG